MKIKLRFLQSTDLDNLLKIENDERYWHLSETTEPFTKKELSDYIKNADADINEFNQLRFVIDVDNQFSGLIDLYEYDSNQSKAGVGIILFEEFQKKGIAQQSLDLLKNFCVKELDLNSLFARIEIDNLKSIKLFEKCGFKYYYLLKKYIEKNNVKVDCKEFSIIL